MRTILTLLSLLIYFSPLKGEESFILLYQAEGHKSHFSYLVDKENRRYFLKQPKFDFVQDRLNLALDALGCTIADQSGLIFNQVRIIPAGTAFVGKVEIDRAATLHTEAIGRSLEEKGPFHNLDIRQKSPTQAYVPPDQCGLTRTIIRNLTLHNDLPSIAALDTYLGNSDRSVENLFYDEENNRFCGIDMDLIFTGPLSRFAKMHIETLIKKRALSKSEKQSLIIYREKLAYLQEQFPPEAIDELLFDYVSQLKDNSNEILIDKLIKSYRKRLRENYEETTALIKLLNQL